MPYWHKLNTACTFIVSFTLRVLFIDATNSIIADKSKICLIRTNRKSLLVRNVTYRVQEVATGQSDGVITHHDDVDTSSDDVIINDLQNTKTKTN